MSTKTPELEKLKASKIDLFVDAWIDNKFNGAKAVRIAYDIGSKGGKAGSTASQMANELLKKPKVIRKIRERMDSGVIDKAWVIGQLKRHAEGKPSKVSLGAVDRVAHVLGLELTAPQSAGQLGQPAVNITFGLASPSDAPQVEQSNPIDAEVSEG